MQGTVRHQCVIYQGSPAKQLGGIAGVIARKLDANYRCLYLNSPTMVAGIQPYLAARGLDVGQQVDRGALVLTSDQSHLTGGRFHAEKMLLNLANAVDAALENGFDGLFATGDMTWEFGGERDFAKLLEYEHALELLFEMQPALSGLCQYHSDMVPRDAIRDALYTHEAIYISETLSRINPYYAPRDAQVQSRPKLSAADLSHMLNRVQHSAAC